MRQALFIGIMWIVCVSATALGQTIVNTETLLLDADEVFQWTAGVSGDFSHGNSNVVDLSLDAGASWNRKQWSIKSAGAWARLAEDGNDIQSNAFGQLRIMVGDIKRIQPFGFAQSSRNNVLLLSQRNLLGAGIRRRLIDGDVFFFDASLGSFWEQETYTAEANELPQKMVRNSLILSIGWEVSDDATLRVTSYAQSAYSNLFDSRVFVESSLNLTLTERMTFEWNFGCRFDGEPHGGLGKWDLGNTIGLRFGTVQAE